MKRILSSEISKFIGKKISLSGWVGKRRDHGKIIFIDLRDREGLVQVVFTPAEICYKLAETLRPEYVISIEGIVEKRPKGQENPKIPTGNLEIIASSLEILNKARTLPFEIENKEKEIDEALRLKYRYLDLRRTRLKNNLISRYKIIKFIRDYMDDAGFVEVETPILTKSTPEGARDYLVPSRLQIGQFYALPQAPQQLKQLLMISGLEKYFQIAKCFRDEDLRGDRQPEFTQLDIESSFVSEEDIISLTENLLIKIIEKLFAGKKIQEIPFPKISYQDAIKKYKTDKPDLRKNKNNLAFSWIYDFPAFIYNKEEKRLEPHHHPFTDIKGSISDLKKDPTKIKAKTYDLILNGEEIAGGSIRIADPELQMKVFEILGYSKNEIKEKFGHLISALEYGAPPHGGIAWGLDRIIMILLSEPNIREVIAFPKTGDGRDLMMNAPASVSDKQLKELGIKIENKKRKSF